MNNMNVDAFAVSKPHHFPMSNRENPAITIVDRPCGSGKTTALLRSFSKQNKYLVIVPFLTEVDRVIAHANVPFVQPANEDATKSGHLRQLLCDGNNVVTTHKLYSIIVEMVREGLLNDYHICVDEVFDVCRSLDGKKPRSWEMIYVGNGFVTVDDDGKVTPTPKWDAEWDDVDDTIDPRLYHIAKSGCLYVVNGKFFMWAMPQELLTAGISMTIYTFKAEGSLLLAYLDKLGVRYIHNVDAQAEADFKAKARDLITIKTLPALERTSLTYSGQDKGASGKRISGTLKKLRFRQLNNVSHENIMLTCRKANWYFKGNSDEQNAKPGPYSSRSDMFRVNWVANTTRGTNKFKHCTHLIYLWDQHMNQFVKQWLGLSGNEVNDQYAMTELIQWVWRSQIRDGKPITLYLPSPRMRRLFTRWLDGNL